MNLLFSMSLAGSLVFLVYMILKPVVVRYFSSAWRYRFLKAALIIYLLPYQYLKYTYYDLFYDVFFQTKYQSPQFRKVFFLYDMDRLILVDSEGNRSLKNEKTLIALLTIWGIAVLSFTIYQIVKYISCKRKLQRISITPDAELCRIFDQCRLHVCMRRKVKLFCCSYINTPLTMGMFSPRIIMPESMKEERIVQMAISHELYHVKNRDICTKFLALLIMALHWYNPLTYLFYYEICKVSEYACDESVIQGMTEEEKEKYELLIVELAEKPSQPKTVFANALSGNYERMKERIALMNRSIISSKGMRIVAFSLAVLLFAMSPIPVLAYSPMIKGISTIPGNDSNFDSEIGYSVSLEDTYNFFDVYDPFLELETEYDIFVSDSGISSVIEETKDHDGRSTCNHVWINGKISNHYKNNDGSCIVNIYNGKKCSQCNEYIIDNLYTSMNYPQCPH